MFLKILLLFTLIPIIELALLIQIGQHIGFWPTLGIILATGLAGAALAKLQGLLVLKQVRADLEHGRIPGDALINGLFVLVAGALLLTPGVLTDVAGLLLLLPPVWVPLRRLLKRRFVAWMERGSARMDAHFSKGPSAEEHEDDIIDV